MCVSVSVSRLVPPGPVLLSQHPVERSETKLPLESFSLGCSRRQQQTIVLSQTPLWLRTVIWWFLAGDGSIAQRELDGSVSEAAHDKPAAVRGTRLAPVSALLLNFTAEVVEMSYSII